MGTPNDYTCSIADPIYKQSQADWGSGNPDYSYGSIVLRPDSFSSNYNIAHSYGPYNIAGMESGSLQRVWKAEALSGSGKVDLYRIEDDGTTFSTASTLFTYVGSTIEEIDVAFDSGGRPVISAGRNVSGSSEVWFYYFKTIISDYIFEKIANGRTPRTILDRPAAPESSDILLVYTSGSDNKLFYRQQRDAYLTEYNIAVPVPASVSGTFSGYCSDGVISGSMTGSSSGSIVGTWTGTRFDGSFVGTGSGDSVGTIFETTSSLRATGSFSGGLTGSFSGTLDGLMNSIRYYGTLNTGLGGSAIIFGNATGSFSGSVSAYVYRARSNPLVGGFAGYLSGSVSRSISGSSVSGTVMYAQITGSSIGLGGSGSRIFSYLEGALSGSATGTIAGNLTGISSGSNTDVFSFYVEDAAKLTDSRISIYYSRRNKLTTKYSAGKFETVLYPQKYYENVSASFSLVTSSLVQSVLYGYTNSESFTSISFSFVTASLRDMILSTSLYYPESYTSFSLEFLTASLKDVIVTHSMYYPELISTMSLSFVTASRNDIIISHTLYYAEEISSMSLSFVTASLES